MSLSEVYFYMILILFQLPTLFILSSSEDLKFKKHYFLFIKISLVIILIGIIMELIGWNHLYPFQCIFITSIPFFIINIIKGTIVLFKILFKKEPFQMYRNKLSNGFYWINPFYSRKKISLRASNFDSERLKVNDKLGNPVI